MKNLLKLLLILFLIPAISFAQMSGSNQISSGNIYTLKSFSVSLDGTGTTDIATATGNVGIVYVLMYVTTAPGGLTSTAVTTSDTTPTTIVGATLLASLTSGKNIIPLQTAPFILGDTKKIQRVNVGTGTGGGVLTVLVLYFKGTGDLN